ncbi:MAG: hypothetical protein NWQ54_24925 [Paraglaciecola sp.]|uniref:hypothetical protein n=1 Tax=Paraglaciecola sp. TaxID=1920173 RepID=UPI00273F9EC7|nr:hypothetical protein [Paraglaciecola sp.]MDP5032685.1 hypothetical protein [Paraglaciecola sp.]MDP5134141.1 hypothetical protein [Paraglaciecola sp.]
MKSCIFKSFANTAKKLLALTLSIALIGNVFAQESEDEELARMQAQLNANVLSKPFLAEKPQEVDAYIKSMIEKKVKPEPYQGTYWRPGYTCRDLLRYNWTEYRNCRYYYQYYGRYY